jgi:ferritin-like metal-binding protein YciE
MTEKMMSLQDLMIKELNDLHNAETQVMKSLPKMQKAASSRELQQAFGHHLEETQSQIERLKQVFDMFGERPDNKKCKGMEGLIEEGSEVMKMKGDAATRDAALIAAAQRVEHYEIAGYGTLKTYAKRLGNNRAAEILESILSEEKETDVKLTQLAERGGINVEAAEAATRQ